MPDRGLSAAIIEELAKYQITVAHLFRFDWKVADGGPDYLADGRIDLPWDGNTYLATGDLLEIPQLKDTIAPALDSITISIPGANQANIYKALAADYTNVPVSIYRALLNETTMQFVGLPVEIYMGVINSPDIQEDPADGTSKISWKVTSHWAGFERVAGRRCNDSDQQKWFPGDKGLEYASKSIAVLKWGSA